MDASRGHVLPACLAVAVAVLALGHVVCNDFTWDDAQYALHNPAIRSLGNVPRFFGLGYWAREGKTSLRSYRPLRETSLAVDHALWGALPAGYHLTSLLSHALLVLCVYAFAVRIVRSRTGALFAALLFAVHPSRVEVLATVENRAEIFAAGFVIMAFLCWWAASERSGAGKSVALGAAALAFMLALMSKTIAVALPIAMAAALLMLPRRADRGAALAALCALAAIGAAFVAATMALVTPEPATANPLAELSAAWSPALVVKTLAWYVKMALAPVHMIADARLAAPSAPLAKWYALAALLVAAIALWLGLARLRRGAASFGLAWSLAFLLPVLNFPLIAGRPLAEQRLYLPLAGLGLCAAALLRTRARRSLALLGLLAFAALACGRTFVWRDNMPLWVQTVRVAPGNSRARHNLGMQYIKHRLYAQAVAQLRIASEEDPGAIDTIRALAQAHRLNGRPGLAYQILARAAAAHPDQVDLRLDMADIDVARGHWDDAKRICREATQIPSGRAHAYERLAAVHVKLRDLEGAERVLKHGIQAAPTAANLWLRLSDVYLGMRRPGDALDSARRAAALAPRSSAAHIRMAAACMGLGRPKEAEASLSRALQLDPENAQARRMLGLLGRRGGGQ